MVKSTLWKALFGKDADKLEKANDDERTYYIIEKEPLVNKFISVPKVWDFDMGLPELLIILGLFYNWVMWFSSHIMLVRHLYQFMSYIHIIWL